MKPKEFITKYHLERGWNSRVQEPFLQDFTNELIAFLELYHAQNNIRGFDNAVKVIRMKWDAVSNKIPYGLPDKLWSYFWATVVCKLREQLCPAEVARMNQRRLDWEIRKAEKEAKREAEERRWRENAQESIWERIAMLYMLLDSTPSDSFAYMGLKEDATPEEIMKRYRELSLKCHPDKGGSQEEFIKLTEHKNKALKWASR